MSDLVERVRILNQWVNIYRRFKALVGLIEENKDNKTFLLNISPVFLRSMWKKDSYDKMIYSLFPDDLSSDNKMIMFIQIKSDYISLASGVLDYIAEVNGVSKLEDWNYFLKYYQLEDSLKKSSFKNIAI